MSTFPQTRLRRLRRTGALRDLVRETHVDRRDLVMPFFVGPDTRSNEGLPALGRYSVSDLPREVEAVGASGIPGVILFGIPDAKDDEGSGAWDPDGVIQQALRELRDRFGELLLLTDVCLCEYTSHGHCGVVDEHGVRNDESLELLAPMVVSHADAGADAVCPSDMMDGRVAAIWSAADDACHEPPPILVSTRPSTPPRSTARSGRRPSRRRRSATEAGTRWIRQRPRGTP